MKIVLALAIFFLWSISASSQTTIQLADVNKHIGDSVMVCGKVSGGRYLEKSKGAPTFLNLGEAFPNHALTVVIWNDVRKQFEIAPELLFKDKEVCVTGRVELFKDKPQIVVRRMEDVREVIK
jgi:hypothetical protein